MATYIKVHPYHGLNLIQHVDDLKDMNCAFGSKGNGWLYCGDCQCTEIVYAVIVEAEMTLDISHFVHNMANEKVTAIRAIKCAKCDSTNIQSDSIKPDDIKEVKVKGVNERRVPRYVKQDLKGAKD